MTEHALGYLPDHPLEVASRTNPARWPMDLLMEAVPFQAIPESYLDANIAPQALDQDGLGACVAFAACGIKSAQEHVDWGRWLFASGSWAVPQSGAFLAYTWLKHGSPDGSFPGDGIPGSEGSYPEAVWKLAKAYGLPDAVGGLHKISAYYSHDFGSPADLAFVLQVILTYGPVNFATPWPGNWSGPQPPRYEVPAPGAMIGGHSFAVAGWDRNPDGTYWLVGVNSWGPDWTTPQGIFRFKAEWLYQAPMGPQVVWKTVDILDAPTPPPPPGGDMVPATDNIPRLLLVPVGTQCYSPTAGTPLVKVGGTKPARVYSPCAATATQYLARISTGGVLQLVRVNKADVTVIASSPIS